MLTHCQMGRCPVECWEIQSQEGITTLLTVAGSPKENKQFWIDIIFIHFAICTYKIYMYAYVNVLTYVLMCLYSHVFILLGMKTVLSL